MERREPRRRLDIFAPPSKWRLKKRASGALSTGPTSRKEAKVWSKRGKNPILSFFFPPQSKRMDGPSEMVKGKGQRHTKESSRDCKRRRVCTTDALPNELWAYIFNGTDRRHRPVLDPRWRFCVAQVCRSFRACIASPSVHEAKRIRETAMPRGASPDAWIAGRILCASAVRDAVAALPSGSDSVTVWHDMSVATLRLTTDVETAESLTVAAAFIASGHDDAMLCARSRWLFDKRSTVVQTEPWFERPWPPLLGRRCMWTVGPQRWEPACLALNLLRAACRAGSDAAVGFLLRQYGEAMFATSHAPVCSSGGATDEGHVQVRDLYKACAIDAVKVGAVDVVARLVRVRERPWTQSKAWKTAWRYCARAPVHADIAMMMHLVNVLDCDPTIVCSEDRPYNRVVAGGFGSGTDLTVRIEWLSQGKHWCQNVLESDRPALLDAAITLRPDSCGDAFDSLNALCGAVANGATASIAWLVDRKRAELSLILSTGENWYHFIEHVSRTWSTLDALMVGIDALVDALAGGRPLPELSIDRMPQFAIWGRLGPLSVAVMRLWHTPSPVPPIVIEYAVHTISHMMRSDDFRGLDVVVDTLDRTPAMARIDLWTIAERAHHRIACCDPPEMDYMGDSLCATTPKSAVSVINALHYMAQRTGLVESSPSRTDGRFSRDPACWRRWCRPRPIQVNTDIALSDTHCAADPQKALIDAGLFFFSPDGAGATP